MSVAGARKECVPRVVELVELRHESVGLGVGHPVHGGVRCELILLLDLAHVRLVRSVLYTIFYVL